MEGHVIVYVVSQGEYSDYRIKAIFSTRALAVAYRKIWCARSSKWSDYSNVEKWEIDDPQWLSCHYEVTMAKNGEVYQAEIEVGSSQGFLKWCRFAEGIPLLSWAVDTDKRSRAIKVVNEKRAQIIAANLWGSPEAIALI